VRFIDRLFPQSLFSRVCLIVAIVFSSVVGAMVPVTESQALDSIKEVFSQATSVGEKLPVAEGKALAWTVYNGEEVLGYAFETNDVVKIPAYSGKPVNTLVMMDVDGKIRGTRVLEHHEPILLVGIPEQKLFDFVAAYIGLNVSDQVRVGAGNNSDAVNVDVISGATVTVMVVNESIMSSARRFAQIMGLAGMSEQAATPPATIKPDLFVPADWQTLTGDGSIRRLMLVEADIDKAFEGTAAATQGEPDQDRQQRMFIDMFYAPLNIPTIGRNLLGDEQYNWLMGELEEGDQALAVMGIDGFPGFREMAIFIVRHQYDFDLGTPWQLELLVRRQVGALDSIFTSFHADYLTPEKYLDRPAPIVEPEPEALWVSIWKERAFQIGVLCVALVVLFIVIFIQDVLVRYPRLMHGIRRVYLVFTVFFIGWYTLGQLSVVNVFTFVHALKDDFRWDLFLLDPMLFILWGFVAMTMLLWGRGIFCGWLCPFGALQELINEVARFFKIRQFEIPFAVHERLWALKYVILLGLFAVVEICDSAGVICGVTGVSR